MMEHVHLQSDEFGQHLDLNLSKVAQDETGLEFFEGSYALSSGCSGPVLAAISKGEVHFAAEMGGEWEIWHAHLRGERLEGLELLEPASLLVMLV